MKERARIELHFGLSYGFSILTGDSVLAGYILCP